MHLEKLSEIEKIKIIAESENFHEVARFIDDKSEAVRLALAIQYDGEDGADSEIERLISDEYPCVRMMMVIRGKVSISHLLKACGDNNLQIANLAKDRLKLLGVA